MSQHAVSVVCDLAEPASVQRAAAEIVALHLPIVGLLNNAGIMQMRATKNALGWDMSFATNHLMRGDDEHERRRGRERLASVG
ncbi:MAG TPA: hypothetical protein VNO21_01930 [Polyangiaceae bacterium]|nr:hypothetical protein [Polyangiaceae bacterium]